MAIVADGPLPVNGHRFLTPEFLLVKLRQHPLTKSLYPVAMGRYLRAAGHRMDRQEHLNHLLMYCTEGQGIMRAYGKERLITAGNLVLLPPGIKHFYEADATLPWSIYWVHFEGELADHFSERFEMKMDSGVGSVGYQPRAIADFESLLELREQGYTATNVIYSVHLLQQLLSFLALQLRLQHTPGSLELDLESLEALMSERLQGELNLDTLAARANMSKFYFSKKFNDLTDTSPIQYFINMKMQRACELLDTSSHLVKHIAADLGYDDPYYFSRLFKKVIGLSPAQYRNDKHR